MANNVKLNDNKWHEVRLNRVGRSFTISIDNAHREGGRECNLIIPVLKKMKVGLLLGSLGFLFFRVCLCH